MGRPAIVTPATGLVAGVLVGLVGVAALAGARWPGREEESPSAPRPSAAAARAFLDAYRRSRLGTWAVDARFERRTAAGAALTSEMHIAQRPPDRVVKGLGTIDARRDSRRWACAADAAGAVTCRDGGPAPPYEAEVAEELQTLAGYVGPEGFYAVTREGSTCFRLHLRAALPSPPYGQGALFCYDPETGAPVRTEIERIEGIDRTVALAVRARPTEADLDPER
jgi:hypothetical protein